jgi:hypothetical protein
MSLKPYMYSNNSVKNVLTDLERCLKICCSFIELDLRVLVNVVLL